MYSLLLFDMVNHRKKPMKRGFVCGWLREAPAGNNFTAGTFTNLAPGNPAGKIAKNFFVSLFYFES